MGLQSAVIGYRFGFGYEQGKRTLRAMSNEQFNNLDEEAEQAIFKRHDSAAINYFKTEMNNWVQLQNLIIEKSVEIEVAKAIRTPSAFREMFEGFTKGFTDQQTQDAGNFFASLTDPIMKLMSWFSGHKQTTQVSAPVPTSPFVPTPDGAIPPPQVEITPTSTNKGIPGFPTLAFFNGREDRFNIWQNVVTLAKMARTQNLKAKQGKYTTLEKVITQQEKNRVAIALQRRQKLHGQD